MFEPRNILVPIDFSEHSKTALKHAASIARKFNARLHVLHVVDDEIQQCFYDYCLDEKIMSQIEEQSAKTTAENLQRTLLALEGMGSVELTTVVRKGKPHEAILEEQEMKGIDLIVMASRGKSGLLGQLMGSVTDRVLRGAKCPVLVV
jgi:nucleotide-binding universal stress UspA family protein